MGNVGLQSFEQLGYTKKDLTDQTDVLMGEMMKDFSPCEITRDVAEKVLGRMFDYKG
jgi:hypothetical protein